jgi:hypothetical protein
MCNPFLVDVDEDPGEIRAELARRRRQAQLAASEILADQGRDDVRVLRPVVGSVLSAAIPPAPR